MLLEIFHALCVEQARMYRAALKSDLYMGAEIGLEMAIERLANHPELADRPEVKAATRRIAAGLPAMPAM